MAITFKYGAPGPILQAGFAAGVGNRQKKQQEDALEIWEQQNQQQFQAGQAAINRQFQFGLQQQQFGQQLALQDKRFEQQSLQDQEQRTFQAGQADLGRKFQAEQTKGLIDARAAESGRDREHDLTLAGRRESFLRDTATLEGIRSGALELPPEAQNRLRQLESGRVVAMTLDPIQQQEFMEQYEMEKSTLLGLAQPAKQPTIGEDFEQRTFEKGGTLYQRGKDGGFDVLREAPEDTQADVANAFNDRVIKRYEKLRSQESEDTGERISDEEAQRQAIAEEMQATQFRQRLSGQQQAQPGMPTMVTGSWKGSWEGYDKGGAEQSMRPTETAATPQQAAAQQPTSLLTPSDIAAINAGGVMHDDLRFKTGPDGQQIRGSTDLSGKFVPHAQQSPGVVLDKLNKGLPVSEQEKKSAYDEYINLYGAQLAKIGGTDQGGSPDPATIELGKKLGTVVKVTSPDQLAQLPAGTLVQMPDGSTWKVPQTRP